MTSRNPVPRTGQDDVEKPLSTDTGAAGEIKDGTDGNAILHHSSSKILLVMLSVYISSFLIALDKTILATAIPRITDHFSSLRDIGWYASSYMLTLCSFQLLWGRIYTFYSPKPVFLCSILIFEIGSAVCGAAPSSAAFIFGRAISGIGSAGMTNGSIIIMMHTVPLAKRPMYQGLIGAVFGVASVIGPLLGGVFTEKLSWRWCFYINLPCGAVVVILLLLFLHLPSRTSLQTPLLQQIRQLDPLGTIFFLSSITSLLFALQWGGTTYAWSNWRIITLLVLFPLLLLSFLTIQFVNPGTATLPLRILNCRTIVSALIFTSTSQASMLVITYFIPLFFQALQSLSPISSGLATLSTILALVFGTIFAGGLVQKIGYPAPLMYASVCLSAVGAGLISTWPLTVTKARWIPYQVVFGLGIGVGMQQPTMLAQIVLPPADVPTGISLMFLGQNLGGAVFIAVAQNVFADRLAWVLSAIPALRLGREDVAEMGATRIREMVPKEVLGMVLDGYWGAIRKAFFVGVGLAAASFIGAVGVEWRSVKEGKEGSGEGKKREGKRENEVDV